MKLKPINEKFLEKRSLPLLTSSAINREVTLWLSVELSPLMLVGAVISNGCSVKKGNGQMDGEAQDCW